LAPVHPGVSNEKALAMRVARRFGTFLLMLSVALTGLELAGLTAAQAAKPTVLVFLPLTGPVGTSVTITGTGFTGASSVTFGGHTATFTEVSDLQIDTVVPNDATTGPIAVTTPGGVGTSLVDFAVTTIDARRRGVPAADRSGRHLRHYHGNRLHRRHLGHVRRPNRLVR
jgi:IPT/TIG domain